MIDYAEEIFKSIKTIAKKELESLNYDSTIEATITDDTKSQYGIYTVTSGSAYFTAYSADNNYKKKDVVLVTIPQSDYSKEKIIIGKKNNLEDDKPLMYVSPFSQIIDITNNLVLNQDLTFKIAANSDNYAWENGSKKDAYSNFFASMDNDSDIVFWSARDYKSEQENDNFKEEKGLTRVGLKADFQTLLKNYNIISGNYGLILCIGFRNPGEEDSVIINEEDSNTIKIKSTIIQPFVFDSDDFFGNIYDFQSDYTQEAVFDISAYSDLILSDIFLFAYQKKNFKNSSNRLINVEKDIEDQDINNIFIKNIYICLGTDRINFKEDFAEIYSFSSPLYNIENSNINNDIKEVKLRWVHKDEDLNMIKSLTQDDFDTDYKDKYEIRWYKYRLGAQSPDSFMNMYWERFYGYSIDDNLIGTENSDYATNKFSVFLKPEVKKDKEVLYALILNKEEQSILTRCNNIEFLNQQEIISNMIVKDINALSIRYNDNEEGNYFLYDNLHKLKEGNNNTRHWKAVFAEDKNNIYEKDDLKPPFETIKWIIPAENTMITALNPFDDGATTIASLFSQADPNNKYPVYTYPEDEHFIIKWNKERKNYELIFSEGLGQDNNFYLKIPFSLKEELNFGNGNNTITLEVNKNGQQYLAQSSMIFGIFGTSGSDYNLNIVWDNQSHAFNIADPDEIISGHMELYDPKGKLIQLQEDWSYEYNWYKINNKNDSNLIVDSEFNNFSIQHKKDEETGVIFPMSMNELYILEVRLKDFGNYDLITRTPIPLINSSAITDNNNNLFTFKIDQIEGPTAVRYSSDGTINFDKTPYHITFQKYNNSTHKYDLKENDAGFWRIISTDNTDAGVPKLGYNIEDNINDIIDFFIDPNSDDNRKKVFLYRLIMGTTDKRNNTLTLKDLSEINLVTLKNSINASYDAGTLEQIENSLEDLISQYKSLFIRKNNNLIQKDTHNNLLSLLYILQTLPLVAGYNDGPQAVTDVLQEKVWLNLQGHLGLLPPSIYVNNLPLCGIQFIYNDNGAQIPVWTQPLYIYQDNYPSPTLNQWNGELQINDNNQTILAKGISAGRKEEEDNTFTGVMFGDWIKDSVNTPQTGIYGFNHGVMTYSLKEDGSAFFGGDKGKIYLNADNQIELKVLDNDNLVQITPGTLLIQKNQKDLLHISEDNYLLQSYNYAEPETDFLTKEILTPGTGFSFNLNQGIMRGYNFSLFSQSVNNKNIYNLELSSVGSNDSPFFQIGKERQMNASYNITNWYDEFITLKNDFYDVINKQYESVVTMLTVLNYLFKISDDNNNNSIFAITSTTIDNVTYTSLRSLYLVLLKESKNRTRNNFITFLKDNNISQDYWGEVSTLLLKQLNSEQFETIENLINGLLPKDSDYNFTMDRSKNLFYPKLTETITNMLKNVDSSTASSLYSFITKEYFNAKTMLEDELNKPTPKLAIINTYTQKTNEEGEKLINNYLNLLDDINYSYETKTVNAENSENITEQITVEYLVISDGVYKMKKYSDSDANEYPDRSCVYMQHQNNKFHFNENLIFEETSPYLYKSQVIQVPSTSNSSTPVYMEIVNVALKDGDLTQVESNINIQFNISPSSCGKSLIFLFATSPDVITGGSWLSGTSSDGRIYYLKAYSPSIQERVGLDNIKNMCIAKVNEYTSSLKNCYNDQEVLLLNAYGSYYDKFKTNKINNVEKSVLNAIKQQKILSLNRKICPELPYIYLPTSKIIGENKILITKEQLEDDKCFIYYKQGSDQYTQITKNNLTELRNLDGTEITTYNIDNLATEYCLNNAEHLTPSDINISNYYVISLYDNSSNPLRAYDYVLNTRGYNTLISTSGSSKTYYHFIEDGFDIWRVLCEIVYREEVADAKAKAAQETSFDIENLSFYWQNNLFYIDQSGGYITSNNYRPTYTRKNAQDHYVRKPTDNQQIEIINSAWPNYSKGMKGFVIDLTHDRFVLGNNSYIEGHQTEVTQPSATTPYHRYFRISAGGNFITKNNVDVLQTLNKPEENTWFIVAYSGMNPEPINGPKYNLTFGVSWDGYVHCRGIKYI